MKRTFAPARIATPAAALLCAVATAASAQAVHFNINAVADVKPISRFIYGVNQGLSGSYANATLTRLGGNRWTAYNWGNNASNAGSDWHFQNDNFLVSGAEYAALQNTPGGALVPTLDAAGAAGAGVVVTIPINGYVSADKLGNGDVRYPNGDTSQPPVANYLQTRFRPEQPAKGAPFTLTPNPNSPVVYQDEFVNWVKNKYPYGQTDPNRPIFYSLDNEPDIWSGTHAEVHPSPATYAELVQKTIAYSTAIKNVAPGAKVFGPVNYGWQGYVTLQNAPDSAANGDFQAYYLKQMAQAGQAGRRLLDVLDVHWYPEATGGGTRVTSQSTSSAVVAARLQAPRSLWDASYTETSWITRDSTHAPIALLPRLQAKINANYPGTGLSISEYNYGGGNHISGGIAEADVLGIFGKQGVFSANEWPLAANESFIGGAFLMYRNFDGHNATFGDTSVAAASDNVADTSIYASLDSANPHRMVLVAINKTNHSISGALQLANLPDVTAAEVYQLTSAGATPRFAGNLSLAGGNAFNYTMPAYSVSTLELTLAPEPGSLGVGAAAGAVLLLARRRRYSGACP